MQKCGVRSVVPLGLALLFGCGGASDALPRQPVWGKVTLDGAPLAAGTIQFSPEGQGAGVTGGSPINAGAYSIPRDVGLVPGTYRVSINSGAESGGADAAAAPGPRPAMAKEIVPAKYNAKSTLSAEVKAGASNAFEFELTSK